MADSFCFSAFDSVYDSLCDFEKKVLDSFSSCIPEFCDKKIAAAVSGGADSVSLLISLCNIFSPAGKTVNVVTVNHHIRAESETCGDVDFVVDLCNRLKNDGKLVECSVVDLPEGFVNECAGKRKAGIEEAARFLRYEAFADFCRKNQIDVLCLAHNKNDNLETVLMRFLQGGNAQSLCGIPVMRKLTEKSVIFRPLLQIERCEIEKFLNDGGFSWRTDCTNLDVKYLRNKIRLKLIPFLNDEFPWWQSAVLNGVEKNRCDSSFFERIVDDFPIFVKENNKGETSTKCGDSLGGGNGDIVVGGVWNASCGDDGGGINDGEFEYVKINVHDFLLLDDAVKSRVIIKAMNMAGERSRISSIFIADLIGEIKKKNGCASTDFGTEFSKKYGNVQILYKKGFVFFKKALKNHTDLVFFDIIEKDGDYYFPFGCFSVRTDEINTDFEEKFCEKSESSKYYENVKKNVSIYINDCFCCKGISLPFIVRSFKSCDLVRTSDGGEKKVTSVLSDWHVDEADKKMVPVVQSLQSKQPIICILAAFLGYKNWIVKDL